MENGSINISTSTPLGQSIYRRTILPLPPYQFSIEVVKLLHSKNIESEAFEVFEATFKFATSPDINDTLRMVEIEEDLIPLIENTDNNIFYRPLFFPTVFINNEFKYEDEIIKGITIIDMSNLPSNLRIEGVDEKDYLIMYTSTKDYKYYARMISLSRDISYVIGESLEYSRNLSKYIRLIICNIIDMVEGNDEDLELTTIHTTKEQNIKRIKRGQVAFPTKVFIRPKKEFKQYIKDFIQKDEENKKSKLSYKFLTRGHWRHFRSERFVRRRGEKIWIKPFYKGQGIIISKEYKLIK